MNRLFRSFGLLAAVALAAACTFAVSARETIVATARAARDRVFGWLDAVSAPFARRADWTDIQRAEVPLVQARAFVMRLAKRERPVTTSRWRMCPST